MDGITIMGTGSYVPPKLATNEDFMKIVDTSDEWIVSRTGIKTRHIANEPVWLMGVKASKEALKEANIDANDIDLILSTSVTPDYSTPGVSCLIAQHLEAKNAICIDINAACTGFVYGLDMAQKYLKSGEYKHVLVVSPEKLSRITDYTDRSTCVLFGDGAGAAVVTGPVEGKLFSSFLGADVSGAGALFARHTEEANPFKEKEPANKYDGFEEHDNEYLYMNGKEVYKFATRALPLAIDGACKKCGITVDEIKYIVPHQANIRIVKTACERMGVSMDKMFVNVEKYGNTSSASVPIGLDELNKAGLAKKGDLIALVGFGAGLTYGATIVEW